MFWGLNGLRNLDFMDGWWTIDDNDYLFKVIRLTGWWIYYEINYFIPISKMSLEMMRPDMNFICFFLVCLHRYVYVYIGCGCV